MVDAEVLDDPALALELREAGLGSLDAGHAHVVGNRDHERTGVEIARPGDSVDLEHGALGVALVHRVAVVDDALEDGQRADLHRAARMEHVEEYAKALADAIDAALAGWVVRSVERVATASGRSVDDGLMAAATEAGETARAEAGVRVRQLLEADIDEQRTTPLSILRDAIRYPSAVLRDAGVPPVERDDYSREAFPDDDYDLTPASFADIDPALTEPALAWGAAKAWTHKERHKR